MEFCRKFILTLDPPGEGLPNLSTLNKYPPFILPDVSINITSITSLLQYTSPDGTLNSLWKGTLSDNIVVKDHFLNNVSREFSYVHLDPTPKHN